ncbi:MAG: hypothetical protein Q7P63_10905 [Verrucomicrobiota bacterium JB022]|nr:hypothetical protein [Verrucomicrobiota bacterium JB022]
MKIAVNIAGALLGLAFVAFALMYFFMEMPQPEFPADSAPAHFNAAFMPTGYMDFVKVMELIGGLLVAIPITRNFGLLIVGPIIVNIIAFHYFVMAGEGLFSPILIAIVVLALFLLLAGGKRFAGLARAD